MSALPTANLDAAAKALCEQQRFELVGPLGQGAFKKAYLARGAGGSPFALKLALITGAPDRLLRETEALRACEHAAISTLLAAFPFQFEQATFWVVVEEYLEGGTLEQRLRQSLLPATEVRGLALSLADVLLHLHPRRLVHRDIKPANIMFRADGAPVLTDFGIVRVLDAPSLTKAFLGQGPGTPAYAAPEQLLNDKALIDWRTDQYDLAIVLFESIFGHHPFLRAHGSVHDAIVAVANRETLPIESANKLAGAGFECLIQALAPWPVGRFRRPAQFIEALQG